MLGRSYSGAVDVNGLLMKLNMATRQWHADVDDPWLDLLRPNVSRADYFGQLVRTYGFVAPIESACMYTPRLDHVIDMHQLTRAGLIAQDLLALGLTPAQVATIPQCDTITTYSDVAEALGWLYVVERATLLQDGIRRHLLGVLPELSQACAYLSAYDGRAIDHWTAFGHQLDEVATDTAIQDAIIAAAYAGFACVRQWFRHHVGPDTRRSVG